MKESKRYIKIDLYQSVIKNILGLSLFILGSVTYAQVTSSIDTTQIRVGEEIIYSIQVETDSTDLVLFPEGQSFNPLEVIESYELDTIKIQDRIRLIKKYGLTQFDSGNYTLPSQRIIINNNPFDTDSVQVEVAKVVVDTTKQKMFHIKPTFEVENPGFDIEKLFWWLIPILLLIAIGIFFYLKKRKREETKHQLPPYEEAIRALQELDHSYFLENDNSKRYYSSLTEILKTYIGKEVDDTALESTSNELIERLILHKDSGNFDFDRATIKKIQIQQSKLFKKYLKFKHDKSEMNEMNYDDYKKMMEAPGIETQIYEYYYQDELAACVISDFLDDAISMVYSFYSENFLKNSMGKFMILDHFELANKLNKKYVYLGYWVEGCDKMDYKSKFNSSEILINNKWEHHLI